MTLEERIKKLDSILELLQDSGFIYDKVMGGVTGVTQMPPPSGTKMNCESAARIFMQLAKDMGVPIEELQALYYKAGTNGYFVPAGTVRALGGMPEINTFAAKGWEFENHWRVRDTVTGTIYDPTFGTKSPMNPGGILASSMTYDKSFNMTTVYGEKIQIKRMGIRVECTELNKMPIASKYNLSDANFIAKAMTHIR